jgi:hypothetical protein
MPQPLRGLPAWPRAAAKTLDFKEQVPQWLSPKEKFRRTAGATVGRMMR